MLFDKDIIAECEAIMKPTYRCKKCLLANETIVYACLCTGHNCDRCGIPTSTLATTVEDKAKADTIFKEYLKGLANKRKIK